MTVEARGHQQVVRGSLATLWAAFEELGEPKDLSEIEPAATVTVTRANGEAVLTDVEATVAGEFSNELRVNLPPEQTETVDRLTVAWTVNLGTVGEPVDVTFTTSAEIVGAHLFTLGEGLRAVQREAQITVDAARIEAERARIADAFEERAGVSFIPRYGQEIVDGSGTADLWLSRMRPIRVLSIEERQGTGSEWDGWDPEDVARIEAEPQGQIWSTGGAVFRRGTRNIRVSYVHGHEQPPAEIRRVAFKLLGAQIAPSSVPSGAMSISDELGTFRMWIPGERGRRFSDPDVEAVVDAYSERVPGVG